MRCPFCSYHDSKVLDTRPTEEGNSIRRRRECNECMRRFTTYEKIEDVPLVVIKKDGSRQVFEGNKILKGLIKSCEKRSIPMEILEKTALEIERELKSNMDREVTTEKIGQLVMDRLKNIDEVAYVRFASVYREFKDINTFLEEIEILLKKK